MWVIGTEKRERLGAIVVRVGVLGAVGREVVKLSSKSTEDAARVKYAKLLVVLGLARGKTSREQHYGDYKALDTFCLASIGLPEPCCDRGSRSVTGDHSEERSRFCGGALKGFTKTGDPDIYTRLGFSHLSSGPVQTILRLCVLTTATRR